MYCDIFYTFLPIAHPFTLKTNNMKRRLKYEWTPEIDDMITTLKMEGQTYPYISFMLHQKFNFFATAKTVRERYIYYIIANRSELEDWEKKIIDDMVQDIGTKWTIITKHLKVGRTDRQVKNYFYVNRRNKQPRKKRRYKKKKTKVLQAPTSAPSPVVQDNLLEFLDSFDFEDICEGHFSLEELQNKII